ncbi:MAG: TIGR03087 family PEP-CTERM/XrtA system glycosyltransferase [Methylomarinum sp.]|nr:TIGR03087 family PEP-CTERM/XrtA system glycosyltransferase [Methylomarinum sp.]
MKNLLFLSHRIPYPPNKGDKIRSYHFLKGLAENYHIHLAAFIDDEEDWTYVDKVNAIATDSLFINLKPTESKIKSLSGLVTNKALTIPYYYNKHLQSWVDETIKENKIEKVLIFSSAMAQYVQKHQDLDVVIDFVDVDSDKWLQYSEKTKCPMSWVYKRESKKLLEFDGKVAEFAKMNLFVSEDESLLFKRLVDITPNKIDFVNNGVDTAYFNVDEQVNNPYPNKHGIIVFTGAMDYWANVGAVVWLVNHVFPLIKQHSQHAQFYIVGSKPSKEVLNLANTEDVFVTGRVEDIRPYLSYANVVVAPLQIARGIQNKVLEAMAMGKKIVATPQAIEGINITNQAVSIKSNPDEFAKQVILYLEDDQDSTFIVENRRFVEEQFSWESSLKKLTHIID